MAVCFGVVISMKMRMFFVGALMLLCSRLCVSAAINNAAGIATVPQSSIRSGLIRSPNPLDTSGNLIITGNIGGGKYFRGSVPYSATSAFEAPLGSSSLDSFLRRSASSLDLGIYTGTGQPYFSRSRTVTTTRVGRSGVVSSATTFLRTNSARSGASSSPLRDESYVLGKLSEKQDLLVDSRLKFRPVSEQEKLALANLDTFRRDKDLADTLQSTRVQGIRKALSRDKAGNDLRDKSLVAEVPDVAVREEGLLQEQKLVDLRISNQRLAEELSRRIAEIKKRDKLAESRILKDASDKNVSSQPEGEEVLRKDLPELYDVHGKMEVVSGAQEASPVREAEQAVGERTIGKLSGRSLTGMGNGAHLRTDLLGLDSYNRLRRQNKAFAERSDDSAHNYTDERLSAGHTSAIETATRSYGGDRGTVAACQERFARFSKEKVVQRLKSADGFLKQGEYYRAADEYTLASVYTDDNPLVWASKGHALFAAGEYMSSALFLSKALVILSSVDVSDGVRGLASLSKNFLLIDRDVIENRMVDVKLWLGNSDAGELHFLSGYVYYQLGRLGEAKSAIDKACEKIPESSAAILLRKAIESGRLKAKARGN